MTLALHSHYVNEATGTSAWTGGTWDPDGDSAPDPAESAQCRSGQSLNFWLASSMYEVFQ